MKEVKLQTSPVMLEDKNIRTIDISLIYPTITKDEDIYNYDIMMAILNNHTKNFPNEKDFSIEVSKHLILHYRATTRRIGDTRYIRFDLSIPEKDIVSNYSIEGAIKFFKEVIYNPLTDGEKFDEKIFEREREYMLARLNDSNNNNIYYQSFNRFAKTIDPNEEVFLSFEEELKHLKNANAKRSFELYKKIVWESDPLIYVFGNYNESELKPLIEKYFPSKNKEITVRMLYDTIFHPLPHELVEETSKFNQTALFMLYDITDFKIEEMEYLTLISNILGQNENDLIFKALRLNNNLVYSSSVTKCPYNGLIFVETYLNYNNKDRAIALVKETIESLKDKKILEECIKKLLKGLEVDMLRQEDSKYSVMVNRIDTDLNLRTLKYIFESYQKMKIDDIIAFLNRINLNTIYVLRGENND